MVRSTALLFIVAAAVPACGSPAAGPGSTSSADSRGKKAAPVLDVIQTNLVADLPGLAAVTDPQLVDAWGLAFNPAGPPWISDNGTGRTTVYDSKGALKLTVTIPAPASAGAAGVSAPTGQVFNGVATDFGGDHFIFVTEDGTISGWNGGPTAAIHVDNSASGAVYKGVAIGTDSAGARQLYAANFHTGSIEVYDTSFAPVAGGYGPSFVDQDLPQGWAPFNVFVSGTSVFVAFAEQQAPANHDEVDGRGLGVVDLFDTDGNFQQRLVSGGALDAPWGMAIAPATWGSLAGSLLVGNFGDGHVNAYDLTNNPGYCPLAHLGSLGDSKGAALAIDGLWALVFAPDAGGQSSSSLHFTAGPQQESHGLYGRLDVAAPAPVAATP
jgi:uncharacterized protein (TIGR03118 family)